MIKKLSQNLINILGYNIIQIDEIEKIINDTNKLSGLDRLKISKKLIKKYPNIPFFYLIAAESLHWQCDPEKFKYFNKYGEIRQIWLKENNLEKLNLDFIWNGMFTGSLGNHFPVESLINARRTKLIKNKNFFSVIGKKNKPRNYKLYQMFKKYINFIEDNHISSSISGLEKILTLPLGFCVPLEKECPYLDLASNVTQNELVKQNKNRNIFEKNDLLLNSAADHFKKFAIDKNSWFVTLHMREPYYRGENVFNTSEDWRNTNINTYLKAIKYIISKGGYVFRMGDKNSTPLPSIEGLVDYAHSELKSEEMDVYLGSRNKFCIASSSGYYHIPMFFGNPVLFTNSPIFIEYYGLRENDFYIPRMIKNNHENKIINFKEFSNKYNSIRTSKDHFGKSNISVIENSEDEILHSVKEINESLDNKKFEETKLQTKFKNIISMNTSDYLINGIIPKANISSYFADKHKELIN